MKTYKIGTNQEIIEKQFKKWFGDDFKLDVEVRYEDYVGKTKIEIIFTTDEKAIWFCKYKGKYYGNAMSGVFEKDKYAIVDTFYLLRENAIETLKELKK